MIRYVVARYVDDLTRNEPVNVGVIAYDGRDILAQFDGEDPRTGTIDLRRVRRRITATNTYRAWTTYWRRALVEPAALGDHLSGIEPGDPTIIDYLLSLGGDEFSLVPGGEILFDADGVSLAETLARLFARLVREPEPEPPPSLRDKSEETMRLAGVALDDVARFQKEPEIQLAVGEVAQTQQVSYAVLNGSWHYLMETPFDPRSVRTSSKEAHHVAFVFEHAAVDAQSKVALYDATDIVDNTRGLLDVIRPFAELIDVSAPSTAASPLRDALSLA